ncbi:MAG: DUF2911 domain-containing protein [Bernardetiaceae bacterium]|jgi:hypothetical protein|nr:DUF2911 domain-containing protein [Bernardetiaceae bacterium]
MTNLRLFVVALVCALPLVGRGQNLPQSSPAAEVKQVVGLTEVKVVYHRPGVKNRKIWGKLVPYDVVWRTGANEATVVSFSDDVTVNDLRIKAGDYALFTMPARSGEWTVLLNKDTRSWGTTGFKEENNVLTIRAKPRKIPFKETFEISLENLGRNSAELLISWEKLAIPLVIKVDVDRKANENLDAAVRNAGENWRVLANCVEYCLRNNLRLGEARQWVDRCITLHDQQNAKNFFPFWLKADLLALDNDFAGAVKMAEKSLQFGLAEQGDRFIYKKVLEESIDFWKKRLQ